MRRQKIYSKPLLALIFVSLGFFMFLALCGCSPKPPKRVVIKHTVSSGESISASLQENGISQETSSLIITKLTNVFNPRSSRAGDYYEAVVSTTGALFSFSYYPSRGFKYYEITTSSSGEFISKALDLPSQNIVRKSRGKIKTSLWEAMSAEGLEGELIIRFAEIFSSYVDFLTDTRQGDEYKLIWEEKVLTAGGGSKRTIIGKIIAASYQNRGEKHIAVGFAPQHAEEDYDYYSLDGKSLRLAFLRAPLSYRRISSHFSRSRVHPILRIARPHHGIDYVAPHGTPVSSIGDGVVKAKGRHHGYGNLVRILHPNGYESYYGHLSRFAKISVGSRVKQGQVIGYVGATGLATGPHLHFEIRKNRVPLNFLKLKLPTAKRIADKHKREFEVIAQKALQELDGF